MVVAENDYCVMVFVVNDVADDIDGDGIVENFDDVDGGAGDVVVHALQHQINCMLFDLLYLVDVTTNPY